MVVMYKYLNIFKNNVCLCIDTTENNKVLRKLIEFELIDSNMVEVFQSEDLADIIVVTVDSRSLTNTHDADRKMPF